MFLVDPNQPRAWENWWTYQYGRDLVVSPIWEKGKRNQQVYLPTSAEWRDVWHPEKTYRGGQTIETRAELHQIPLFIRDGVNLPIGDLSREWQESVEIARKKPDLKTLEATIKLN
jgi:alpha-D-xyloside xylohydrolase